MASGVPSCGLKSGPLSVGGPKVEAQNTVLPVIFSVVVPVA